MSNIYHGNFGSLRATGKASMAHNDNAHMIVAIDVGTSKVVCLIGQVNAAEDGLEIIGMGTRASRGVRKGDINDIEATTRAIHEAVSEAELLADCSVHSVYIGIAGSHVNGRNSHAVVATRDGVVSQSDIERVIDAARSGGSPNDQRVLHVIPQEFMVDSQSGVRNPVGMSGVRLEGHIHMVSCSANAAANLERCVEEAGYQIDELVLGPLASSSAVLTEDEKELGVCLIDVGGGTTDITVFVNGAIRYSVVIPIAGNQVTNDIAMALRTPTPAADDIKVRYACVVPQMVDPEQTISVPGMGDRPARTMARQTLSAVVEPRYEELFSLILAELERSGYAEQLAAGIVLTGGSSRIEGAAQLAESIFHLPVRIGMPKSLKVGGMEELLNNPVYSTAIGLLMYGKSRFAGGASKRDKRSNATSGLSGLMKGFSFWLKQNF